MAESVELIYSTTTASVRVAVTLPDGVRNDLFEERTTEDAGIGLFALQDIPAGTQIFNEVALVHLPVWANVATLNRALNRLDDTQREAFAALSFHKFPEENPDWIEEVRGVYTGQDEDFESYCDNLLTSWRIYQTNRFTTERDGAGNPQTMALFVNAARLNHSCQPNVFHRYNRQTGKMSIHTTRKVLLDEQLCTSYIDICKARKDRRSKLRYWGFDCSCTLCGLNHNEFRDARRRQISTSMTRMKRKTFNLSSKDSENALVNITKILKLMRDEYIDEPDTTGIVYQCAIRHCSALHRPAQANEMAKKELEVLARCLGIDSQEYQTASRYHSSRMTP